MITLSVEARSSSSINLPVLVLARICTTAIFMTYPACLSVLLVEWQMSATKAGIVQGTFTAVFAVSLLVASFLCDRIGAKRVFNTATMLAAISAVLFALFATSFESAVVLIALVGLAQGGTYTPAIMLVSANTPKTKTASAVGWVLAGMSLGYVISIFLSAAAMSLYGYQAAFLSTALITVAGWGLGLLAVRHARDQTDEPDATQLTTESFLPRRARLLTLGYIGHCWELFGAWT